MVQPKWIIEHIFDDHTDQLVQSLKKMGVDHKVISDAAQYNTDWKELYSPEECVVTHGSIQFGNLVQRYTKWIPGHICADDNYKCSYFYPKFGDLLLNSNFIMLPYGCLVDKTDFIFEVMGIQDAIFIRPDGGKKSFSGMITYKENFEKDFGLMGFYDEVKPESICVISNPRNLVGEWRLQIVNDKVITGSKYKEWNAGLYQAKFSRVKEDSPEFKYAEKVLQEVKYAPDIAWCLDICQTKEGELYVLETGSFSSAGVYDVDTDKLVEAINKAAIEEWEEYQV